jgi:hypothetical protein
MDRSKKSQVLLQRAEKLGLRLELDSGLLIVKRKESGDPETQDSLLAELAKHLGDVRPVVQQRAIDAGANKFLGARIWSREQGEGTLKGASNGPEVRRGIFELSRGTSSDSKNISGREE